MKLPRCVFVLKLLLMISGVRAQQAPATNYPPLLTNTLGMVFVLIPAGEFQMGSRDREVQAFLFEMEQKNVAAWYRQSPPSEIPRHPVRLAQPFYFGAHEVTVGSFSNFVQQTGYRTDAERDGAGGDGRSEGKWTRRAEFNWRNMGYNRDDTEPVVNVTWNDAVAFCEWLSKKERARYRLPTEAEWEYACRAGTTTRYFWGDTDEHRDEYVWHAENAGGFPHPVAQLKSNAFGLFDLNGNVYEYCSDWFSTNWYQKAALEAQRNGILINPTGPSAGTEKVVRGGSWGTAPMHCRSAFRGGAGLTHRNMRDGFRVVREVP
jgi:formylglycine-generating enzyme required for sulfatase activity